jgi:putative addiction module component (TIGR02574 family)
VTQATQALLKRALTLAPVDRAELIEALFRSFDRDRRGSARFDALWAKEAESRLDAHLAGKIKSDTAEAVFRRVGKR